MNKMSLAAIVLHVVSVMISAQPGQSCGTKAGILLSKDKPTIYITFDRAGKVNQMPSKLAAADQSVSRSDDQDGQTIQVVWLRLHNNTRWAINFPTDSLYVGPKILPIRLCDGRGALGLRTDTEVSVRYEVEYIIGYKSSRTSDGGGTVNTPVDATKPLLINRGDMFATSWLPPGGSVLFTVPREHLAEGLAIYITYNYEWEYGERTFRSDEPQHRVYFQASGLPKKVQAK